jgi:hypothetical protein
MAIVISYPSAQPTLSTLLLGSQHDPEIGASATKNFSVSNIANLAKDVTLAGGVSGSFEITNLTNITQVTVVDGIITGIVIVG